VTSSYMPMSESARSKTWVWGRSLTGSAGSNPAGGTDMSLVSVVCFHIEVSASGWSLVQRSPIVCGVSEYDFVVWMRGFWLTGGCCAVGEKLIYTHICEYFILVIIILAYCNCQLLSCYCT